MGVEAPARLELAQGYTISRVIHGGWQLTPDHGGGPRDPGELRDRLHRLVEHGFTTFDCADIYEGVEDVFGRFAALCRARQELPEVQVHTKFVPDRQELAALGREEVARAIEGSLTRLGVERLDLVQFHWWDYGVDRAVEVAGWLEALRQEGKIRCLGATNFDRPRLEALLDAGVPLVAHQVQYSLLDRRPEAGMAELSRSRGVRLLCYGSLAGGLLTGRHRGAPDRGASPGNRSLVKYRLVLEECGGWPALQRILEALDGVGFRHGVCAASVALRWALDRPGVGAVILGLGRADHLRNTLDALALSLDAEDEETLQAALDTVPPPPGDVYSLERAPGGRHAAILRTGLRRRRRG